MSLLTVIIPTYNAAATLHRALTSLQTQTSQYFSIIIQDGNSTDHTLEIAESFSPFFKERLTIFSEPDNGIYDAMNIAIEKSKGDWFYFLGADDYVYNTNVFEIIGDDLQNENIHFLYGNVYSPDYGLRYDGKFSFEKILNRNICHQAIFYRRQLFEQVGNYNITYKVSADWDFNIRCFSHQEVRTKYVDILVAFFAPGGFGKQVKDAPFIKEQKRLELEYIKKNKPLLFLSLMVKRSVSKLLPK